MSSLERLCLPQTHFFYRLLAAVLVITISTFASPLLAQVSDDTSEASEPLGGEQADAGITVQDAQAALAALEADASLEESVKAILRPKYEAAIESLQAAADFETRAQEYRNAIATGPERRQTIRSELDELKSTGDAIPPATGTAQELQNELDSRRVSLELLRERLAEVTEQATRVKARPVEIPTRQAAVQRELTAAQERLASPDFAEENLGRTLAADKLLLQANEKKLASEAKMLEQEQLSQPIREELLAAQVELLQAQIAAAEEAVTRLSERLSASLTDLAERVRNAAEAVPSWLLQESPRAEEITGEVRALAAELEMVLEDEEQTEAIREKLRSERETLETEFEYVREQLELGSGGSVLVQLLFNLDRQCLATQAELRESRVPAPQQPRIAALRVRKELREQAELEKQIGAELPTELGNVVAARREALEELDRQYSSLTRTISLTEKERQQYLDQTAEARDFVAEQLFGFGLKSCPPLRLASLNELPAAVQWQFQLEHWREVATGLTNAATQQTLPTLSVILLAILLIFLRPRFVRTLEETGRRIRKVSTDRYRNTLEAALWTVLLALPWPLLIGYAAWTLGQLPQPSNWMAGFRAGVERSAWIVLFASLFLSSLRRGGLGAAHFGWNEELLARVRGVVFRIFLVYVPLLLVTISCTYGDASQYLESLGRVSFMLAHLWMAIELVRLFFAKKGLLSKPLGSHDPGFFGRLRWLWFILLSAAPLALVGLMVVGYMITSIILSIGLLVTLAIIAGGSLLHGFVLRWLAMRQRQLALADALQRRRARQEEEDDDTPTEVVDVEPESGYDFDREDVAEQTRGLLRAIFNLSVLVAVIGFWAQAFPIIDLADSVRLPFLGGLTLLRMAIAILVAVVTITVVKNLPGLLESVVLRSPDTLPGTRIAIYTLCQYGATALGIWFFLYTIQVDWAQFGWAVAALSVGIGFGLQEVVANFVCGLILLFERPIRVGDVVTVENMTGTVSKIHLRATTITNWDRQEFLVPNKTLITSTLLNWTLSAPLNRVVIPVGVAYGTDTERARELLLSVAKDHPNVLESPQPMASFEQFADSSLNIVLRVYLPDLDGRLSTISELHTEINRRFENAGIEIAFPQRDLHIRSGWPAATAGAPTEKAAT